MPRAPAWKARPFRAGFGVASSAQTGAEQGDIDHEARSARHRGAGRVGRARACPRHARPAGRDRGVEARRRLRSRRQVRQILQRGRLCRRREVQEGHRRRVPRLRAPERGAEGAGAQALRPRRAFADRRRRVQSAGGAREGRGRVPEPALRDHRCRGREAERPLDHLQGARGLLSGRHARRDGFEDRQGRLRRRHGHSADPQVRLRLRARRQGGEEGRAGVPEHDRHHRRRLERPGQGRRAREEPDRSRRRRRLPCRRRHRHRRAARGRRRRQARHRGRFESEHAPPGEGADLDGEARRRRDPYRLRAGARPELGRPPHPRFERGRRRLGGRRAQQGAVTPEMRSAIETAAADIKDGKVQVHDYMADGKCPS